MSNRIFGLNLLLVAALALALSVSAFAQATEIKQAFEQGLTAFTLGQYERALFEYRTALTWPGEHQARTHFNIGVCHHKLGRAREAVAEYRAAIKLREGKYVAASYALGVALQGLRQHPEARAAFAEAVEASGGNHAESLFELGLYAQVRRDLAERNLVEHDLNAAMEFYNRALAQSKDRMPAAHNNLGVILAGYGQMEDALREFELALRQSRGKFAAARDNLLRCRDALSAKSGTLIAELKTSEIRRQINPANE